MNDLFGEAHQYFRPTPLLSALIDGAIEKGCDVTHGGARFNSAGTSNIGLVDVTSGFWSMSPHVTYGSLSGPLPSGRLAGKAFTPGLTPQPRASRTFLDNMTSVASLGPVWKTV